LHNKLAIRAFALSLLGTITNQLVYVTNPPPLSRASERAQRARFSMVAWRETGEAA